MSSSDSETRKVIKRFHFRRFSRDRAADISTPVLTFSDATSRDDLYALPSKLTSSGFPRPRTADGMKNRKRVHVADLIVEQVPGRVDQTVEQYINDSCEESIGLALGSPTQWPLPPTHRRKPSAEALRASGVPRPVAPAARSTKMDVESKAELKRSVFGSIFKRRISFTSQQRQFYTSQAPRSSPHSPAIMNKHRSRLPQDNESRPAALTAPGTPGSHYPPRNVAGMRPPLKKYNTSPMHYPNQAPKPPPKDFPPRSPAILFKAEETSKFTKFLEIDIPDVSMERYSIMFGDVLAEPRQSPTVREEEDSQGIQVKDEATLASLDSSPDLLSMQRAILQPSPKSSQFSLFPTPQPIHKPVGMQRAGLSRSNTLPSPVIQQSSRPMFPERKASRVDKKQSLFHGSKSSTSTHSTWPSDESPESSDLSEDDDRDDETVKIVVQLDDGRHTNALAIHTLHVSPPPNLKAAPCEETKPLTELAAPRKVMRASERPPRTSSRPNINIRLPIGSTAPAIRRKSVPKSSTQAGDGVAPGAERKLASQKVGARAAQHHNPLQSSPASPTEITMARSLSLSRSQQTLVPFAKTVRQPQLPKVVNPDTFPEPVGWKMPSPAHMRNKSTQVVVETA